MRHASYPIALRLPPPLRDPMCIGRSVLSVVVSRRAADAVPIVARKVLANQPNVNGIDRDVPIVHVVRRKQR